MTAFARLLLVLLAVTLAAASLIPLVATVAVLGLVRNNQDTQRGVVSPI